MLSHMKRQLETGSELSAVGAEWVKTVAARM
jgi:hypothetical protein